MALLKQIMPRFQFQLESVYQLKRQLLRKLELECMRIRSEIHHQQTLRGEIDLSIASESRCASLLTGRAEWIESLQTRIESIDACVNSLQTEYAAAVESRRDLQVEIEALATLRSEQLKQFRRDSNRTRQSDLIETILRPSD